MDILDDMGVSKLSAKVFFLKRTFHLFSASSTTKYNTADSNDLMWFGLTYPCREAATGAGRTRPSLWICVLLMQCQCCPAVCWNLSFCTFIALMWIRKCDVFQTHPYAQCAKCKLSYLLETNGDEIRVIMDLVRNTHWHFFSHNFTITKK